MKYKLLVLDHDDTVVASSEAIHFPAFEEFLKIHRPGLEKNYDFSLYMEKNFEPGITDLLSKEVGLSAEEMAEEEAFWAAFVDSHIPLAYPGISELLADYRAAGGILAVDSHSLSSYILRDYRYNRLPIPDVIYGWDLPSEQRKPSPYTLYRLMETYHVRPEEMLVVDDLKPGFDMAKAAGVPIAAAGWAYDVPTIRAFMEQNADYYLSSVEDLRALLFSE